MSGGDWLDYTRECVEEARASFEGWTDIVADLRREGIEAGIIHQVLQEHHAWTAEACEWKACGFPYDELALHLREQLAAEWRDVARALMEAGLPPADMLRVVLPLLEADESMPIVQAALLEGPEDADYGEVCGVLEFFFPDEADILGSLDVEGAQLECLEQRLGLKD